MLRYFLTFDNITKKYIKNLIYYSSSDINYIGNFDTFIVGTIQLCCENGHIKDANIYKYKRTYYFGYYTDGNFYPIIFSFRFSGNGFENLVDYIKKSKKPLKNTITIVPNY